MATKPGSTYTHATDLTFTSGPANTFDTKLPVPFPAQGFIPGTGADAEHVNTLFNITGDWITSWLALGSAVAGLDAHLVETSGSGETRIATGIFGGTLAAGPGLVVTENAGIQSATIFNSNAAGNALEVGATSTIAAAIITNNGNGVGLTVDSVGGEGVRVTAGGTLTGLVSTGGPAGGTGVTGIGLGGGFGLNGVAGPTGGGVQALGIATSPQPALAALGSIFPAAQVRGTIYMQPTVVPGTPIDGDFWKRPGTVSLERGGLEWQDPAGGALGAAPGKQRAHSTTEGFGYGYAESLGDTSEAATSTINKVTMSMGSSSGKFNQPNGNYIVEYSATVRLGAGAGLGIRAVVTFLSPGSGSVATYTDFAAVGERKTVSFFMRHTLANPGGPDLFHLAIASNGGAPGPASEVIIDNARIVARGSYE